jgi:penicillin amidase
MRELTARTWDELALPNGTRRVATPAPEILLELLHDSANVWWDDHRTHEVVEDRDAIVDASLGAAFDSLTTRLGPRANGQWRWDRVGAARVSHLLSLRGFSALGIPIQGGPGTLNPAGPRGFGPSWRMVVELGQTVTAMGTYPGGQSGNPASPRYLDRLPFWRDGRLDTLFMPADTSAMARTTHARATLAPKRGSK